MALQSLALFLIHSDFIHSIVRGGMGVVVIYLIIFSELYFWTLVAVHPCSAVPEGTSANAVSTLLSATMSPQLNDRAYRTGFPTSFLSK